MQPVIGSVPLLGKPDREHRIPVGLLTRADPDRLPGVVRIPGVVPLPQEVRHADQILVGEGNAHRCVCPTVPVLSPSVPYSQGPMGVGRNPGETPPDGAEHAAQGDAQRHPGQSARSHR